MLDYLYRLDYDDQATSNPKASEGRLTVNARMYALADKYEIWALKELAKRKSVRVLEEDWSGESFLAALEIVWTTTSHLDRGLRDCYLPVITAHKVDLHKRESFMEAASLVDGLAVDIVDEEWKKSSEAGNPTMLNCKNCCGNRSFRCVCRQCGSEGQYTAVKF